MKFLILTQYYPPETGAPQNRLHSLAKRLVSMGHQVEVATAMPNYPKMEIFEGYIGLKYYKEMIEGITVHRSSIYVSKKKNIFNRLLNYFSFVYSSFSMRKKVEKPDYLICESPPLFLGISAIFLSKKLKAKLIFNVSDLWPESAEKLGIVRNKFFLALAYWLEKYIYSKSFLVTGQTQGIVKDINQRFPNINTFWFPNGVDKEVYQVQEDLDWIKRWGLEGKKIFVYAGIIGIAQGLEIILHAKQKIDKKFPDIASKIAVVLIGDGPDKERLISLDKTFNTNITFIPNTPKKKVIKMLKSSDAFIVPLKKLELFLGAIPSKIFDALALSKPIILGVDGEARELFINKGNSGFYFEPENSEELMDQIVYVVKHPKESEDKGINGLEFVSKYFDRKKISENFVEKINKL